MIAGRCGDHALFARLITQQQQPVESAAFLVSRRELTVFELQIDLRTDNAGKRPAEQRGRADDGSRNPFMRRADIIDIDGTRRCVGEDRFLLVTFRHDLWSKAGYFNRYPFWGWEKTGFLP